MKHTTAQTNGDSLPLQLHFTRATPTWNINLQASHVKNGIKQVSKQRDQRVKR